jgi:hypothetical protein
MSFSLTHPVINGVVELIYVNAGRHPNCHGGVMDKRENPAPICPHCGKPMRLARTIPGIGALPELHTYDCKQCGVATGRRHFRLPTQAIHGSGNFIGAPRAGKAPRRWGACGV